MIAEYSKTIIFYGEKYGGKLLLALVIIFIFWFIAGLSKKIITKFSSRAKSKKYVFALLGNFSKITIIIIGIITALGTIGLNVSAIVTSLGLSGFALGFALKDYLSNILAGIMILLYQPYKIGNEISVANNSGNVAEINLRYTVLETTEKKILIPNSTMLNASITVTK